MKKTTTLFVIAFAISTLFNLKAQTNLTNLITNPSFETGNYTGWTWTGRTGGWETVNSDGDATKDGTYIAGYWNNNIGDVECSQSLTGLTNGYYQITALATVSNNRTTTQRLFANAKSELYGASSHAAYSVANLAIFGASETYSFGGYIESTAENGPFKKLSVVTHVTDGNLTFGFRLNGKGTALGYDFSYSPKTDAGFFKFDNFTLTEVSTVATLDNITLSTGSLDAAFNSNTLTYTATLPSGTTTVTPTAYVSVKGENVSGAGAVDVSSGSGSSTIIVTALDGTTTKTYTINYTVLLLSNDATLSALITSAGTLDPAFNSNVTTYTVLLPIGTTTVKPTATKNDAKATIIGDNEVTLVNGKGTSTIIVTAENGTTKTYTINYDFAYITNPSFETGNYNGWTWAGTTGYTWVGVNTDGDATKNGSYIAGTWNSSIGDVELSQTITGLPNGYYRVTGDLMGSSNATTSRLTTQRLFANGKSKLFGTQDLYSAANLAILGATESYLFGGYSETRSDRGPFLKLSVVVNVTDGNLKFGIRSNGKSSTLGYTFPDLTTGDGHGWFKVDNFTITEVSKVATLDNINLSAGSLNEVFVPGTTTYTANLPLGTKTVIPTAIVSADGEIVTGADTVDVSSGSGTSAITVTSIDGTTSKTYTISYTVLTTSEYAVSAYAVDSVGVKFTLESGVLKLQVCNDKIIQVSYSLNSTLPVKDTIIVNKVWGKSDFAVTEDADNVIITTKDLTVHVSKTNSLVSFYDKSGNLILSEDNKKISPVTILGINTNTCSATFNSPVSEGLFGLGQHQQKVMNYKSKTVVLDQQNTEIALPFMVTTRGYGLLWDNYSLTNFNGNISSNTKYQFSSESGKMVDYYFMYGPEIDEVISEYRTASGSAPLFPKWAYGLFQSKDKYTTSNEILNIAKQYRAAKLPLDCIVQDWDYWTPDYWGSHTMDATKYPNPKALIDSLHKINVHTMISIWPVFHSSTANYQEFNAINALYPSNGSHHFYDPHNDQAKQIYWDQVNNKLFTKYGWDAWWADNDEPQGYPDGFDRKGYLTAKGPGVTYYNTYPIQHTASVYNGWRKDISGKRLFTLSRSAFPGQQRYATAAWSGDITSTWGAFQNQLSAGLNFCLSGIPYWTTDIGGYIGTDWTTAANQELMIRWFQYGSFCPIFRIHGKGDKALVSTSSFTKSTIDILASTDRLRYRLMPYIYSTAWKVTNENYTMMRHLVMDYRSDANVKTIDNQFLFGPSMMINPVTSAGVTKRSVYLPAGNWYDFWTGKQYTGSQTINADAPLDKLPIFVKAGSIIPMGPEITYANQSIDTIEVRVYKGANGSFTLYEDEGDTYNYENGSYSVIPFSYNEASKELTIGNRTGSYNNMPVSRNFKIVWVDTINGTGANLSIACDTIVIYNGTQAVILYDTNSIVSSTIRSKNFSPKLGSISYPNPFNSQTTIKFNLTKRENVSLEIYDVLGQKIETLLKGTQSPGEHEIVWVPENKPDGVYFYKLQIGNCLETGKLLLNKSMH